MINTPFTVRSERIHDIRLDEGTNVGYLRRILAGAGYDVNQAKITVIRAAEGDRLIGNNEAYVLKRGDGVEFITREISMPALKQAIDRARASREQRCGQGSARCSCQCSSAQGSSIKVGGISVDIVKTPDGIRIDICK